VEAKETIEEDGGWTAAVYSVAVVPGSSGLRKVWVGRKDSPDEFEWEVSVQLGEPDTSDRRRRDFVSTWYEVSGKQRGLSSGLLPRHANQRTGEGSTDALELSLANTCAALGWPALFGGTVLKTPGVDLIAFDSEEGRAYAISATISNDIAAKFKGWLLVKTDIESKLHPLWKVCPVIVTSQPLASCAPDDLREALEGRVLVLTAENLEWAHEVPPDLDVFQNLVRVDVQPPFHSLLGPPELGWHGPL
jgi:hypothetical protein